jgi:hypothetical protein
MEGAKAQRGGRGIWGSRPGWCVLFRRSWREGCLRTGALTARTSAKVRISSQRDSEAAVLHTTPHCATLYSVQKGTRERGVSARKE